MAKIFRGPPAIKVAEIAPIGVDDDGHMQICRVRPNEYVRLEAETLDSEADEAIADMVAPIHALAGVV